MDLIREKNRALDAICEHLGHLDLEAVPAYHRAVIESAYDIASDAVCIEHRPNLGGTTPTKMRRKLADREERSIMGLSKKHFTSKSSITDKIACMSCPRTFSKWQFEKPDGSLYSLCQDCRKKEVDWKFNANVSDAQDQEMDRREDNILKYREEYEVGPMRLGCVMR